MNLYTANGLGNCFLRSIALTIDLNDSVIMVATVTRSALHFGGSFLHAWVEIGDGVVAPSLFEEHGNQLYKLDRDQYYRDNSISDARRMKRHRFLNFAREGNLAEYFKYGRPSPFGPRIVNILLDRMKVDFVVVKGGVMPAPRLQNPAI